jgi:hypothetical protein
MIHRSMQPGNTLITDADTCIPIVLGQTGQAPFISTLEEICNV